MSQSLDFRVTGGYRQARGITSIVRPVFEAEPTVRKVTIANLGDGQANVVAHRMQTPTRCVRKGDEPVGYDTVAFATATLVPKQMSFRLRANTAPSGSPEGLTTLAATEEAVAVQQLLEDLNWLAWNANDASVSATVLGGNASNSATTLSVAATTGFPDAGKVLVGTERIAYTGKTAGSLTGCTRGVDQTTAASHSTSDAVALVDDFGYLALDGWLVQARALTSQVVDGTQVSGGAMDRGQFKAMLALMPAAYLASAEGAALRWFMSPTTARCFFDGLATAAATSGDAFLLGEDRLSPYGYGIITDAAIPDGSILLTDPLNLAFGISEGLEITQDTNGTSPTYRRFAADFYIAASIIDTRYVVLNEGITVS